MAVTRLSQLEASINEEGATPAMKNANSHECQGAIPKQSDLSTPWVPAADSCRKPSGALRAAPPPRGGVGLVCGMPLSGMAQFARGDLPHQVDERSVP